MLPKIVVFAMIALLAGRNHIEATVQTNNLALDGFCYFCPAVFQWADYIVDQEGKQGEDPNYVIKKLVERGCSQYPDNPKKLNWKGFCISTTGTVINEHLHEWKKTTVLGSEWTHCKKWYPKCGPYY